MDTTRTRLFSLDLRSSRNHAGQLIVFYRLQAPARLEMVFQGYQDIHLPFTWDQKADLAQFFGGATSRVQSLAADGYVVMEPCEGEMKLWAENADGDDRTAVFIKPGEASEVSAALINTTCP